METLASPLEDLLREAGIQPPAERPPHVVFNPALPLYVRSYHANITKRGEELLVEADERPPAAVRLADVGSVILFGNVTVSAPALHVLMERGIPVSWHKRSGWFVGHTVGTGQGNVALRAAQYAAAFDPARTLRIAQALVADKIASPRTLLRRNWKQEHQGGMPAELLEEFHRLLARCGRTTDLDELRGMEGLAAARYFGNFQRMLRSAHGFEVEARNRRPPTDPVNALLSFGYALLLRTMHQICSSVGLDPYMGWLHQPRYGRASLALDLMEPFRSLVVDSTVLQVINNGEVNPAQFERRDGGVLLDPVGKAAFIKAYERRLEQEITHPKYQHRVTFRTALELHVRLWGRHLQNPEEPCPSFQTR